MLERGWYPECFNGNEVLRLTLVTWLALTPIVTHAAVYMHSQTLTHSRHMHAFACILRFPYTPYTTLQSLHGIGAHAPSTSLLYSSYSTPPYSTPPFLLESSAILPDNKISPKSKLNKTIIKIKIKSSGCRAGRIQKNSEPRERTFVRFVLEPAAGTQQQQQLRNTVDRISRYTARRLYSNGESN